GGAEGEEGGGRGRQGGRPVGQLPQGTVNGQQRASQQECEHPGKRLIALLVNEPHVAGGHRGGERSGDQGQRLDPRPSPCPHASSSARRKPSTAAGSK